MDDNNQNVISILVASDVHVGYKEKDPERGKDSFVSLEEIFIIAKQKNVDFILLGGDLFHENKPSRKTLHCTMELFRKYCLGDRPCQVEVVSDQVVNFGHTSSSVTSVNYENPHMNISMPVFSIHGNHDDPTGAGELSAIDFLSVAGLLNHFGKQTKLDEINIQPVLLQKGTTNVALYGLGSIRDERLHHLFLKKNVTFFRPQEKFGDWFNIFVLHQNRAKHGSTNYIPEEFIDEFINLVVWGHEHECRIDLEMNEKKKFFVMQPGSPVATSLCAAEAKPKHVALVKIRGCELKTEKIPLKTSRQMFVEDVVLADCIRLRENETPEKLDSHVRTYCRERVQQLLMRAEDERSGHPKQPTKPLIRLRVDYSGGFDTFNKHRFGAAFADQVANPENVVHFLKKSVKRQVGGIDVDGIDAMINSDVGEKVKIADLVQEFLDKMDKKDQMTLLTARGLSGSVNEFVDKHESGAISKLCQHQIDKTKNHILAKEGEIVFERDEIVTEVNRFHEQREFQERGIDGDESEAGGRGERQASSSFPQFDSGANEELEIKPTSARGKSAKPRGRGRGRGARSKNTASGRESEIMDSFLRQSQASNSYRSLANSYDDRSDDDVIVVEPESSSRVNSSKRSSSMRSGQRKGRVKGVVYDISDEEKDNPFVAAKKKR